MKHICNILFLCLTICAWVTQTNAQAINCGDSYLSPFCSGIAQYPANYDSTGPGSGPQAPTGPNYDCLGTWGNPSYFSLTIDQTGSVNFTLDNTANVDIDFILWGPFSSIAAANSACDSMGHGGAWGAVADCSYSGAPQEPVQIPNAQAGEVYILMVTNYANVATNIFSTQNSGTGNIACPCEIPYTIDTMPPTAGNQGFITDTTNGVNQFVVCVGNTLGIQVNAQSNASDTLSLYGPFTTINNSFANNSVFAMNPNAPTSLNDLSIFALVTPTINEIGVTNFNIGLRNDLYTGGFSDSSCFDLLDIQVVVPGVQLTNRMVCSGESFQIVADSIPSTTLGSSNYVWSQLSGPSVSFSSTSSRTPTITIPTTAATSSNDTILIVVDYDYGGLCPMRDTMMLLFNDVSLATTATPDSICIGQTSTLQVVLSDTLTPSVCDDYNVNTIPFAPITGTGTSISLGDDQLSASLPIGFTFNFFCNNYTNFFISSNGFISFDPNAGSGCCSGQNIPDPFDPNDIIAMCWTDCNPTSGGTIEYFTVGTAPNRQLVVNFINVPPYSTGTGNQTVQAILFENSNVIELHVTNATPSGSFNELTLGIENSTGTLAHAAPGANATTTTISNTAFRFEPKNFGPFYTWSPAGSLSAHDVPTPVASPLATTTYSVTVSDGVCSYIDTTTIHAISGLSSPTVTCDSASLNTISFSWSNLNLPATGYYEYSIDGGTTWINVGATFSATATGLITNTNYTILVRANDGTNGSCPLSPVGTSNCATLNPSCINNPAINITLTPTHLSCNNDSSGCINASVTGGSGNPMNLTWSMGAVDTNIICQLTAGTYTLVVTDTLSTGSTPVSCIDSQTITITEPPVLAITVDSFDHPSCNNSNDGAIYTTTTGGTASYTYNWTNNDVTADISNLTSGTFVVTVTDANGCTATDQTTLVVPNPILITIDSTNNNSCDGTPDGNIYITASGGVGTLTYLWSNLAITEDLIAVPNDDYTVTVTDSNGCSDTASVSIVPVILLTVTDTITHPLCHGDNGSATLTVAGGSGNYTFDWGAASTATGNTTSLSAGTVTITVTDQNNGCTGTHTITLNNPPVLTVSLLDTTNIGCHAAPNSGAVDIQVLGGTSPYTYAWDNMAITEDLTGVIAGNYSVVVTDDNNCTVSGGAYTVEQATSIAVNISTLTGFLSCDLQAIGALQASATGGNNISYTWSNNSTDSTITNLGAGSYTVTASNGDGCTDTASQTIYAPVIPTLDAYVSVTGMTSVSVPLNSSVVLSAGSTGFNYAWTSSADPVTGNANIANPSAAQTTTNPDPAGDYTYIVTASATTNDTTCTATDTVWLTVEAPFQGIPTAFSPDGDGINDTFRPVTLSDEEVKVFRIYNRWGQEVYNGDEAHGEGWDGTFQGVPQPTEVYIYLIEYQKASDPNPSSSKGEFTLIR